MARITLEHEQSKMQSIPMDSRILLAELSKPTNKSGIAPRPTASGTAQDTFIEKVHKLWRSHVLVLNTSNRFLSLNQA